MSSGRSHCAGTGGRGMRPAAPAHASGGPHGFAALLSGRDDQPASSSAFARRGQWKPWEEHKHSGFGVLSALCCVRAGLEVAARSHRSQGVCAFAWQPVHTLGQRPAPSPVPKVSGSTAHGLAALLASYLSLSPRASGAVCRGATVPGTGHLIPLVRLVGSLTGQDLCAKNRLVTTVPSHPRPLTTGPTACARWRGRR